MIIELQHLLGSFIQWQTCANLVHDFCLWWKLRFVIWMQAIDVPRQHVACFSMYHGGYQKSLYRYSYSSQHSRTHHNLHSSPTIPYCTIWCNLIDGCRQAAGLCCLFSVPLHCLCCTSVSFVLTYLLHHIIKPVRNSVSCFVTSLSLLYRSCTCNGFNVKCNKDQVRRDATRSSCGDLWQWTELVSSMMHQCTILVWIIYSFISLSHWHYITCNRKK